MLGWAPQRSWSPESESVGTLSQNFLKKKSGFLVPLPETLLQLVWDKFQKFIIQTLKIAMPR